MQNNNLAIAYKKDCKLGFGTVNPRIQSYTYVHHSTLILKKVATSYINLSHYYLYACADINSLALSWSNTVTMVTRRITNGLVTR